MLLREQVAVPVDVYWFHGLAARDDKECVEKAVRVASRAYAERNSISDDDVVCLQWPMRIGKAVRVDVACGPDITGLGRIRRVEGTWVPSLSSDPADHVPFPRPRGIGAIASVVMRAKGKAS